MLMDQNFEPRDYANDPRFKLELVLQNDAYECSLCKHKFQQCKSSKEQLKPAHLRKQAHRAAMKQKLGMVEKHVEQQPDLSSFFITSKQSRPIQLIQPEKKESLADSVENISLTDIADNNIKIRMSSPRLASADDHRRQKIEGILHSY